MHPDDKARTWAKPRGAACPAEDDWEARRLLMEEVYPLASIRLEDRVAVLVMLDRQRG